MADSITVFGANGTGGVSLSSGNFAVLSVDWGDNQVLAAPRETWRQVRIRVRVAATTAAWATLRQLNRLALHPPKDAEIAFTPSGGSTINYLDIAPPKLTGVAPLTIINPEVVELELYTWPWWRTIRRDQPRILQNLVGNPSFERWAAGVPEQWTLAAAPTLAQSTAWAKYGLYSVEISKVGSIAGIFFDVASVAETQYAVSVYVKPIAGVGQIRLDNGAGGNAVTIGSSSGTAAQRLSGLYTTVAGQTTIRVVIQVLADGDVQFDAVYVALASNTGGAVPAEWIGYTEALYNREDSGAGIINGLHLYDLLGDAPALAELRFHTQSAVGTHDRFLLGIRRNDSEYHFNSGFFQAELGTVNATYAAVGNQANASPAGGGNNMVNCSSALTTWDWMCRVPLTDATHLWQYKRGRYRIFARVFTNAATPSLWDVRAGFYAGVSNSQFGDGAALSLQNLWHLVDLGEFTVPPWGTAEGRTGAAHTIEPLYVELQARRASGTTYLYIDYIWLCPLDDCAQSVEAVGTANWAGSGVYVYTSTLEAREDEGLVSAAAAITVSTGLFTAACIPKGQPLRLPVGSYRDGGQAGCYITSQEIRDDGQHMLTAWWAARIAYVPQYLFWTA